MTRHIIAYEGKLSRDGWFIEVGALRVEREPIPVTTGFDTQHILARATDLQRDEATGAVSMEIEPRNNSIDFEGYSTTIAIYPFDGVQTVEGEKLRLRDGVIREVTFIVGPAPWEDESQALQGS